MATKSAPPAAYYAHKPISCNACRKRKLKCDRVKPCSSCVLRGIENSCYQDDEAIQGGPSSSAAPRRPAATSQTQAGRALSTELEVSTYDQIDSDTLRGAKRPRSSGQQAPSMGPSAVSVGRRGSGALLIDAKAQAHPAPAATTDAVNLIGEVLHNLQRERQRLEEALVAVQQPAPATVPLATSGVSKWDILSDETITYHEHLTQLPPPDVCESLLKFYCDELQLYTDFILPQKLFATWQKLAQGRPVRPIHAAHIVVAIATSAIMLPPSNRIQRSSNPGAYVETWTQLAEGLAHQSFQQSQYLRERQLQAARVEDDLWDGVVGAAMFILYYSLSGQADHLWISIGYTVRRAICCGLYDVRHKAWKMLSMEEHNHRLRVARFTLHSDRWQALIRSSPYAIHPLQVHLPCSFDTGDPYSAMALQTEMLEDAREVAENFDERDPDRYRKALELEARLEHMMRKGLIAYSSDGGNAIMSGQGSLLSYFEGVARSRDAAVSLRELWWLTETAYLRCMATRAFLMDAEAPLSLRFRALEHAQCILSMAPVISRYLVQECLPISTTLTGHYFLCAMTAYDAVLAGERDLYLDFLGAAAGAPPPAAMSSPKTAPPMLSRFAFDSEQASGAARDWPHERRLPPLLPAGMVNTPGGFRETLPSSSRLLSPAHATTGFAESGFRHTQQQQEALTPEQLRTAEHLRWLEMNLAHVTEYLRLLEQHSTINDERSHQLLRILFDLAAKLRRSIPSALGDGMPGSPSGSPTVWSSQRPIHDRTSQNLISPSLRAGPGAQDSSRSMYGSRSGPQPLPTSYFAGQGGAVGKTSRSPATSADDGERRGSDGTRMSVSSAEGKSGVGASAGSVDGRAGAYKTDSIAPGKYDQPGKECDQKYHFERPQLQPFQPLMQGGPAPERLRNRRDGNVDDSHNRVAPSALYEAQDASHGSNRAPSEAGYRQQRVPPPLPYSERAQPRQPQGFVPHPQLSHTSAQHYHPT